MPRIWTAIALCLLCVCSGTGRAALPERVERLEAAPDASTVALRSATRHARPVDAGLENGWWRVTPGAGGERAEGEHAEGEHGRLLLVYHPYSAEVTVRAPPDYRPVVADIFGHGEPAHSRRALVFELASSAPVYVGIRDARYPLQLAIRSPAAYAVEDHAHVRVLWGCIGVLLGVSLVVLLFWLRLRERVYLLFALSMLSQTLYLLCAYGDAYALPGLGWLGRFGVQGIWFVATASTMVTVLFLLDFGELRPRAPRLSQWLWTVGFVLPAVLLAALLVPTGGSKAWFPPLGNGLLLLANALALVALARAWLKGGRHAGFVLIAWVPIVAVSTARAVQLGLGARLVPWLEYGLPLMLAFAAVVLVLGLADRMLMFRRERDEAKQHAEHDGLTGAYNREGIIAGLERALQESRRTHQPVAVLFLDLDRFKTINDTHGHAVGDACLRAVVQVIREQARLGDHLGRVGGEEFLLYLPGATLAAARGTAERLRSEVESRCARVMGAPVGLTLSIGVVGCSDQDDVHSLIERADAAMYQAKRDGRNRVVVFDGDAASSRPQPPAGAG